MTSKDVVFHEHHFPFHYDKQEANAPKQFFLKTISVDTTFEDSFIRNENIDDSHLTAQEQHH